MSEKFRDRARVLRGELILAAAGRMLALRGCDEVSTDELARAVGVGKGTIYLHYPKREALIEATLSNGGAGLEERLEAAKGDDAAERLSRAISTVLDGLAMAAQQGRWASCCFRRSPCPYKSWKAMETRLQALIEDWKLSSPAATSLDPVFAAQALQSMLTAAICSGNSVGPAYAEKLAKVRRGYLALLGLDG